MEKASFLLLFLFYAINIHIFSQAEGLKARVAVFLPENSIMESQPDVISAAISDTIKLTLRLLGKYSVAELSDRPESFSLKDLADYAEDHRLDNIIFGAASKREDGILVFNLSVYDRLKNTVTFSKTETAVSLVDTFDAADKLVAGLLEAFSKTHVGWGTVTLNNKGDKGTYEIVIDGQSVGRGRQSLENILIGTRRIEVKQKRPFGELVLADEQVIFDENQTVSVDFSIPPLTKMEESGFKAIEQALQQNWDSQDKGQVEQQFALAFLLLKRSEASQSLTELKDKYTRWLSDFKKGVRPAEFAGAKGVEQPKEPLKEEKPEEEPLKKPQEVPRLVTAKKPKVFRAPGLITLGIGVTLLTGGGFLHTMSAESFQRGIDSFAGYIEAWENLDALYGVYAQDYKNYQAFGISGYSLWGTGAALVAVSSFVFPPEVFSLSAGGKIILSGSLLLGVAGNIFASAANIQQIENRKLWNEYMGASENLEVLYSAYNGGAGKYLLYRLLSFSLWGVGGLGAISAFITPGEAAPVTSTSASKIFITTGILCFTAGNVLFSSVTTARHEVETAWLEYYDAVSNLDTLYADYQAAYKKYLVKTILSYGLWGVGSAAVLAAVFLPFGSRPVKTAYDSVSFHLVPLSGGIEAGLHIRM
ncbi:MAG: hypothetical protein AB1798_16495 [Spirochaetota bacterium]